MKHGPPTVARPTRPRARHEARHEPGHEAPHEARHEAWHEARCGADADAAAAEARGPSKARPRFAGRRWRAGVLVLLAAGGLAACAGPPLPALSWARLPLQAPGEPTPASLPTVAGGWRLASVTLPGYLQRDAVLVPADGAPQTQLVPLAGLRWGEPLAETVPRLLRRDLALALGSAEGAAPAGGRVTGPGAPPEAAPAAAPARVLRVELLSFEQAAAGSQLAVAARYTLAEPGALRAGEIVFLEPLQGSGAEALVLAHRAAIATLARRLAAALGAAAAPG